MKNIVRKGDTLRPFGGVVLEGHYECDGLPMACEGDAVHCNKHGMTRIDEGSSLMQADDRPVALDGHRCACGCTLVSSLPDSSVEL
ncbi:PAAR domain-containing protein [Pseudomonas sp. LMG 31766]|uniref:PAAR domain-containing protein n=1 Tax=Pseudomonas chaetocerotis TaxID=2758695 RepID=A0A931GE58_9PSED|nr:PAAR domain-containing protein [Pseudomonas chaetocerotis]MBZ9666320.1 PAAR domain-containing protein [Pseudomonas chaetocerotis]